MKFLFIIIILVLIGCQTTSIESPNNKGSDDPRDWEYLYSIELKNALDNQDDMAFHFFWLYYLEARHENKLKKLAKQQVLD